MDIEVLAVYRYIICIPIFFGWAIYDMITKTVKIKWQTKILIGGVIYNLLLLVFLPDGGNVVFFNLVAGVGLLTIMKVYSMKTKLGQGDVYFLALIGFIFGIQIGVLTTLISFVILRFWGKAKQNIRYRVSGITSYSATVAFFPYILWGFVISSAIIDYSHISNAFSIATSWFK